jgi:hypothetical protein
MVAPPLRKFGGGLREARAMPTTRSNTMPGVSISCKRIGAQLSGVNRTSVRSVRVLARVALVENGLSFPRVPHRGRMRTTCADQRAVGDPSSFKISAASTPVEHAPIYRNGFPGCGRFIGGRILWIAPNCVPSATRSGREGARAILDDHHISATSSCKPSGGHVRTIGGILAEGAGLLRVGDFFEFEKIVVERRDRLESAQANVEVAVETLGGRSYRNA